MEHYRTPNNSAGAIGLFAAIVATGARWLSIAHSCLKLECQPPMGARRSAGARSHRQRTAGHLRGPATRRPEDKTVRSLDDLPFAKPADRAHVATSLEKAGRRHE